MKKSIFNEISLMAVLAAFIMVGCSEKPEIGINDPVINQNCALLLSEKIGNRKTVYDSTLINISSTGYKLILSNNSLCPNTALKVIIKVNHVEVLNRVYEGSGPNPTEENITAPGNSIIDVHAEVISSSTPNILCIWTGEVKLELYSNCHD